MTKAGFGEHLKREREMRGVTLDEICVATRISTRFLEALENEEWDRLPGGVFNRGFVRAVARFLGLDEEGFVAEYAMAVNDGNSVPTWTSQTTIKPQTTSSAWVWIVAAVAAIVILGGAGWIGWRWHVRRAALRISSQAPAAASTANTAPSSAVPSAFTPGDAPSANSSDPPPTAGSAPNTTPSSNSSNGATAAAGETPGASPDPASASGDALLLKVEAGKPTSIRVSADGKSVFDGRLAAGENHLFKAQDRFQITAADGGALLLVLNGRTLAPIGPSGRPGRVKLTRRDAPAPAGGFD